MAIRSILVHIDDGSACKYRLHAATQLARQHENASLTGLYVVPTYDFPAYGDVYIDPEFIKESTEALFEHAAYTQNNCRTIIRESGLSMEMCVEDGNSVSALSRHARYHDLLILGQDHPEDPENIYLAPVDPVVLESGTPCLIIPHCGLNDSFTKRILVAWNGSSESARALRDAMPLLKLADHVEVLSINPDESDMDMHKVSGFNISLYLEKHEIDAEIHTGHDTNIGTGNVIMSHAAEIKAGMIVSGGYGHSRLRELILGGVTKHLLKQTTLPLFMSH